MKTLSTYLEEYLSTRRALGFNLKRAEYELNSFVRFLKQKKSLVISSQLAWEWATYSGNASRVTGSKRLGIIRIFARYVFVEDPRHEVPSRYLAPYPKMHRKPVYIYSEDNIIKLMQATQIFQGPLMPQTYRILIGLLGVTGMRIGELIALNHKHFDSSQGSLSIKKSKNGQSRIVLLHPSTIKELKYYQEFQKKINRRSNAFFISNLGTRLHYGNVHHNFDKLLKFVDLYKQTPKPRINDIRHTFIIKTIERWYVEGKRVEAQLGHLSTYVGHVHPNSTYWYLNATPALMACAAKLLNKSMKVVS